MVKLSANIPPLTPYKLIELPPDLLSALEATDTSNELVIKSSSKSGEAIICTADKTFQLRRINQSNTLVLLKPEPASREVNPHLVAFSNINTLLECVPTRGVVDLSCVPLYFGPGSLTGEKQPSNKLLISLAELDSNSPASSLEFDTEFVQSFGTEINGIACLLSRDIVFEFLGLALTTIMALKLNINAILVDELYQAIDETNEPIQIVETIVKRFSNNQKEPYNLDMDKITKWYGIYTLMDSDRDLYVQEFYKRWEANIPVPTGKPLNYFTLKGNYINPESYLIRYFTKERLSSDPKARFAQLFEQKSTWELSEITPFVEDVMHNKAIKIESFIMKFARKRTINKKIIVSARN
ncbi:hypothetical protein NADFUDRAFT_49571 [Nadsonia fulvescens var. elongata DSM 6958]|uniref:Sister chromatid cohesion protein DCC1 n=1 Tax=Nadsonia fulvescens var. elongata DSM 6958 TaxID=857566 RepID=A0A1E3PNW7_9ASCO|nr:hypothetical protein NADFUDRAFT_49571 [Nadsonia fulvescens var. elongata DSM 6958]